MTLSHHQGHLPVAMFSYSCAVVVNNNSTNTEYCIVSLQQMSSDINEVHRTDSDISSNKPSIQRPLVVKFYTLLACKSLYLWLHQVVCTWSQTDKLLFL